MGLCRPEEEWRRADLVAVPHCLKGRNREHRDSPFSGGNHERTTGNGHNMGNSNQVRGKNPSERQAEHQDRLLRKAVLMPS